jgi:hypothetical protein
MKIVKHLELLESLIKEYEERAGRGKSIAAEIRDYAKDEARETLRRVLIDSETKPRLYGQSNFLILSDLVRQLLESHFCACYVNIDLPKPTRRGPFIDIDHLRRAGELRWFEKPEGGLEDSAFQRPPFKLKDIDLAAANLGFYLANAKDKFPPMSDGAAEMLLTETDQPVYQFHWELK